VRVNLVNIIRLAVTVFNQLVLTCYVYVRARQPDQENGYGETFKLILYQGDLLKKDGLVPGIDFN
jgi:hypothetical protein